MLELLNYVDISYCIKANPPRGGDAKPTGLLKEAAGLPE
jgi:hypothetical protein